MRPIWIVYASTGTIQMKDMVSLLAEVREPPLAYRVNPLCRRLGIGRSTLYKMMKSGKIKTVIVGGRRLIPAAEVERLLSASA
jgi:excisionase family DNA binding protein